MPRYIVVDIHCAEISERPLATQVGKDGCYRIEVDRNYLRTIGEMADW